MEMVKVRFAPSPTGNLHIGSARTALFNWLFARHHKGKFILRIEDTDKARSKTEFLEEILDSLRWLGLDWDEGPYFQSERVDIYLEYAHRLIKEGKAYRQEGAIIYKVFPKKVSVEDLIHGRISFDTKEIKDQVLIKNDGLPTYNFACVVDDAAMEVTHVIRGDDHISNTPKQILLYEALGLRPPQFAHIPLILGEDRSRLSKRTGAVAVSEYRKMGYLAEAVVNFLVLLGWSPGENKEIIPKQEMIAKFSLERVNKTSAVFNDEKLEWINAQYIKSMDIGRLKMMIKERLLKKGWLKEEREDRWLEDLVRLLKLRVKNLEDFEEQARFIFEENIEYDPASVKEFLRARRYLKEGFLILFSELEKLEDFTPQRIGDLLRSLAKRVNVTARDFILPVRVALTGRSVSPPLFESIYLLGKEKTLRRLKYALSNLMG